MNKIINDILAGATYQLNFNASGIDTWAKLY
jgi:hypothetical protein